MARRIANALNLFKEGPLSATLHAEDQSHITDLLEDYFYDSCDEIEDNDSSENEECYDKQGTKLLQIVIDTKIKHLRPFQAMNNVLLLWVHICSQTRHPLYTMSRYWTAMTLKQDFQQGMTQ